MQDYNNYMKLDVLVAIHSFEIVKVKLVIQKLGKNKAKNFSEFLLQNK